MRASVRHLPLMFGVLLSTVLLACCTLSSCGPTTAAAISVSLALSSTTTTVAGTVTATATVRVGGSAMSGQAVSFANSSAATASLSAAQATTNAQGQASVTVSGLAPGSTEITATSLGRTSAPGLLTVGAVATTEYVLYLNYDTSVPTLARNIPGGGTPEPADLGGTSAGDTVREYLGAQPGGSRILLTDAGRTGTWVRDLSGSPPTEADFSPEGLVPLAAGAYSAAIAPAGASVLWLNQGAGGAELWIADLDGSNAEALYDEPNPDDPVIVAVSPSGNRIAFITGVPEIRVVSASGGAHTVCDLTGLDTPQAIAWIDNATLAVAVRDADPAAGEQPAIVRVFANGTTSPDMIFNDTVGLRTTPGGISVDREGNILFDEQSEASPAHAIYRLDAPSYDERVVIVPDSENAALPAVMAW